MFFSEKALRRLIKLNVIYHGLFWLVLASMMIYNIFRGENGLTRALSFLFVSLSSGSFTSFFLIGSKRPAVVVRAIQVTIASAAMTLILVEYVLIFIHETTGKTNGKKA